MQEFITDNNEFLPDGVTPNPNIGQTTIVDHDDPPTAPRVLSKTAFQDYVVLKLGGGAAGMARFMEILDATRGSADRVVRFCGERYDAAETFAKGNTTSLTSIMATDVTAGHLTLAERADIIGDSWPTD